MAMSLNCTVCPKCPSFSDLSHLLTHLASKGHLHHEFELRTESKSDPQLKLEYDAFEHWKEANGLDILLDERIKQKGKKKAGKSQPSRKQSAENRTASNKQLTKPRAVGDYGSHAPIDPSLMAGSLADAAGLRRSGRSPVKREFRDMAAPEEYDHELDNHDLIVGVATNPQGPAPTTAAVNQGIARAQGRQPVSADASYRGSESPSLPPARAPKRRNGTAAGMNHESSLSSSPAQKEKVCEYAILKGTVWPGMDLFDSASPHAKRIRNQKKDATVLVAMQAYSETIEPTEEIRYFPSWDVKKTREITGQVESSEDEVHQSEARRQTRAKSNKKPRARRPLSRLDRNKSAGKTVANGSKMIMPSPSVDTTSTIPSSIGTPEPLPHLNSGLPTFWQGEQDDDLNWELDSVGARFQEHRRGKLSVFQDLETTTERITGYHGEEADMFVEHTPTPRPQLPPFRALTTAGTSRQNAPTAAGNSPAGMAPSQSYREPHPVDLHRELVGNQYGLPNATNEFNAGFPEQYGQRYFPVVGNAQPQMSMSVPAYMDYAMGHQSGRLMPPPASFGNGSFNGGFQFGNAMYQDNSFAGMLGTRSPILHQSPTRPSQSQSPTSINPLFEFAPYLPNGGHTGETDNETIDDGLGGM